ncbi:Dehydrogenase xptC [Paramyrothecium foliicola]|nr:Dehydrogenase xptC [Paramyrothecium foliicola]
MKSWLPAIIVALNLVCRSAGHPTVSGEILKRAEIISDELLDSYDFIVVGGGQAGTVIATRLSENPDVNILVVEYGYFNTDPAQLQPNSFSFSTRYQYNITTLPQPGLNDRAVSMFAACCVGGGSTINGMLLNRGSAADYDSWEAVGNKGWGFEGLYPYFIKSSRFDAPSTEATEKYNMTWGEESYGQGPIHLSFSSYQWPGTIIQREGIIEAGAEPQLDGSGGDAFGVIWYPTALDNRTALRSYAVNGYYDPASSRPNLHVLTGWRVDEIEFDKNKKASGVALTKREDNTAGSKSTARVGANLEIVVSAGTVHTPQVLQRSGVGPKWLLDQAGIDAVVDLPGVGSNLQDHPVVGASYNYTTNILPNPDVSLFDPEFAAWAQKELEEHRSGPLRISTGNTGGEVPLTAIDPEGYKTIVEEYLAQDPLEYLPKSYSKEQLAGYKVLRRELAKLMAAPDNAWLELPLTGSSRLSNVLMKCVGRGTILLNTTDVYAEPVVDYHTFTNPTDVRIMTSNVRFIRRMHETAALKQLGPVEVAPGAAVQTDEEIHEYLKRSAGPSIAHNSGTAVMMPRKLGGVVDAELKVYGVKGLSVADASIIPIIPAAHTCSTVYAIAEKVHNLCKESAEKLLSEFQPQLIIAIGGGGYVPARILRSFLKKPGSPNIPIQAIGLSLYEQLGNDADIEEIGTKVTRTQWLDLSALGEMANLVGKRILIVDEVDDTRTTLEYAVKELEKDVELARQRVGGDQPKTEFGIFVLHNKDKQKKGVLPDDMVKNHYHAARTVGDVWICYPWEAQDIEEHDRQAREQGNNDAK